MKIFLGIVSWAIVSAVAVDYGRAQALNENDRVGILCRMFLSWLGIALHVWFGVY